VDDAVVIAKILEGAAAATGRAFAAPSLGQARCSLAPA